MILRISPGRRGLAAALLIVLLAASAGLSSCAHRLGWGLVLWTASEGSIPAGSIVPVYIRSNIDKVYVVGSLDGKKKLELPLWQLELFPTKGKARARLAELGENASLYLIAGRDGLPVRKSAEGAADRVFRLKDGEAVKVLAKAQGEKVQTGGQVLEGDWYFVMTGDGTRGYVFSNTMRLFDERKDGSLAAASAAASESAQAVDVDLLFSRTWRPEYFQSMLDDGRIDLDSFSQRYGLFADAVRKQIRIELPAASEVFNYSGISEKDGDYLFEGTSLKLHFDGESRLSADWSGAEGASDATQAQPDAAGSAATTATTAAGASAGSAAPATTAAMAPTPTAAAPSKEASFVVLSTDIREAIRAEEGRRQKLLDSFLEGGAEWSLPSGSKLLFSRSKRFTLSGAQAFPEGYLPSAFAAGAEAVSGDLAFRLYLSPALASKWEGALSLRSSSDQSGSWADFLYRHEGGELLLEPAGRLSGLEVESASAHPPLRLAKGTH